jgi:hypothetical protein
MGDDQCRRTGFPQQPQRLLLHALAQLHVEPRERFIHKQHRRPRRDGARQRHALLLPAR